MSALAAGERAARELGALRAGPDVAPGAAGRSS